MNHETTSYYDGEGVYAWSCTCGDGDTDYMSLDDAVQGGVWHKIEEQIKTKDQETKESAK